MGSAQAAAVAVAMLLPVMSGGQAGKVEVVVDARVELLACAVSQSEWVHSRATWFSPYAQEMQQAFFPHRQHAAIRRLNALRRPGTSLPQLLTWILTFGPPPGLAPATQPPDEVVQRLGGRQAAGELADALRSFARDSGFGAFFEKHRPLYDSLCAAYAANLEGGHAAAVAGYAGPAGARGSVVIVPLCAPFRYSLPLVEPSGTRYLALDEPDGFRDGALRFDPEASSRRAAVGIARAAAAAALASLGSAQLLRQEGWFAYARPGVEPQGIAGWADYLRENVAWAAATGSARSGSRPERAEQLSAESERLQMLLAPFLLDRLKEYEGARDRYPDLASFAARLLAVLDLVEPAARLGEPKDLGLADVGLTDAGVPVFRVKPGSLAAAAGVRTNDTVTSIGGIRINGSESYLKAWHRWEAALDGEAVPFGVARGGKKLTLSVVMRREQEFNGFRWKAGAR